MQQWRVGDVTVHKVVELEMAGGTRFVLPQATREEARALPWLYPHFADADGRLKMSIHALIVEAPGRRILVDTCLGNDKPRDIPGWSHRQGPFLRDLAAAGFPAESIDAVVCTHLHVDHVGWNTVRAEDRWIPTFPSARYLLGRSEFEYWRTEQRNRSQRVVFEDSVQPVFEAGRVDLVELDHRLCDEVDLIPTLGHTPGHASVRIRSRGEQALITGDFIHHPCQLAHPDWASGPDYDPQHSSKTRHELFHTLASAPTLVIGTHFSGPSAGRIVRDGGAYRMEPHAPA
jgi:glyoxylase-like metal-dependent hydrolase (beta-lactamase superfamily II)